MIVALLLLIPVVRLLTQAQVERRLQTQRTENRAMMFADRGWITPDQAMAAIHRG